MEVLGQSGTTNSVKSGASRAHQLVTDGRNPWKFSASQARLISPSLGSLELVSSSLTGETMEVLGQSGVDCFAKSVVLLVPGPWSRQALEWLRILFFPIPRRYLVAIAGRFILLGRADHSD
ncbi:hypothetical protein KQX54_010032 [Cotesia glomerata]|uniref:Uncharacterized protein n=1 Tax=Cotesia glomerata TaxID=32391 RepID=A0AAV7HQS9_COTGL|nr:hypothetical protein KQX54_010032 [Cotesia glomerata]